MRIYIAGAMTGQAQNGFPAFDAARDLLRQLGHDPVSPADIDRAHGVDADTTHIPPGFRQKALRRDVFAILGCAAIAFLPGWERSPGARLERAVAEAIGLPCYRIDPDASTFCRESIIGISGYARSGKDTLAQYLIERGYEHRAFAAPLKGMLAALDPTLGGSRGRLSAHLTTVGWEGVKQLDEARRLLQRLGTEAGRKHLGEDVWVERLFRTPSAGRIVISDVRFPNEADAIRERGGIIVRVARPGVSAVNAHPSETALDDYEPDLVVVNDGAPEDLKAWADTIVETATRP